MNVIVVNTDFVPGKEIAEVLGLVRISYRYRISVTDCGRLIADMVGPPEVEVIQPEEYNEEMTTGFQQITINEKHPNMFSEGGVTALGRLKKKAEEMSADAVINTRVMTARITSGVSEMLAYGTAVKLR
ncbi:MAG: heavy metal-binding domain-containing protein [Methanophagales archaeon]|nr:heavy metal-binding domain-containing protein [Methanophagales archaeon]